MSNAFERTYWANDVADLLGISTSALRKWSLKLEDAGYSFIRDENDRRAYREGDLVALRKMKEFLDNKMSMENAAKAIYTIYRTDQEPTPRTGIVLSDKERSEDRYQSLEKKLDMYIEQQTAFNKALLEQLQKRDEYIDQVVKTRDEHLLQTMNEVLETKRLLVATQVQPQKKWFEFWK